jgi:hypothetical protein
MPAAFILIFFANQILYLMTAQVAIAAHSRRSSYFARSAIWLSGYGIFRTLFNWLLVYRLPRFTERRQYLHLSSRHTVLYAHLWFLVPAIIGSQS